jgi:HAD superfamily hydrolase (TIGR01509 family)
MNSDVDKTKEARCDRVIQAVIFDCDGVILDSRTANEAFYNRILSHLNKDPLTKEQVSYVHCHTLSESLNFLLGDDDLVQEAERFWSNLDYGPIMHLLTLHPGFKESLEQICPSYKTAIATNRTRTMGEVLERFGLGPYFDLVVTALDVRHPKPHPESLNTILSHFRISPQEAVYIGDSEVDQETSRRAEVLFIAYGNEKLEADLHLNDFSELIPLLERLNHELNPERHVRDGREKP